MTKLKTTMTLGLAAVLVTGSALATEFTDCNMNGLDHVKDEQQSDHVFFARLGNAGQGNGGEAVDATFEYFEGVVSEVTCVGTVDEDTGGALLINPFGTVFDPSDALPEVDPGR